MTKKYSSNAFVLKKTNSGEADQVISFYTEKFGKIEILGKGIRKINSKLKGGTSEIDLLHIEFIETRRKTLVDAKIVLNFPKTKKEPVKVKVGLGIREQLFFLIKYEGEDEKIWSFLKSSLFALEEIKEAKEGLESNKEFLSLQKKCALLYYYFFFNIVSFLGYRPNFENCSFCGDKIIHGKIFFSPEKGFADEKCSKGLMFVPIQTIKIIKFFLQNSIGVVLKIKISKSDLISLKKFRENYYGIFPKSV